MTFRMPVVPEVALVVQAWRRDQGLANRISCLGT
jgi:hypothetical protein